MCVWPVTYKSAWGVSASSTCFFLSNPPFSLLIFSHNLISFSISNYRLSPLSLSPWSYLLLHSLAKQLLTPESPLRTACLATFLSAFSTMKVGDWDRFRGNFLWLPELEQRISSVIAWSQKPLQITAVHVHPEPTWKCKIPLGAFQCKEKFVLYSYC